MRVFFQSPREVAEQIDSVDSLWAGQDGRFLVDRARNIELRRPEFLVAPPSSEEELTRLFGPTVEGLLDTDTSRLPDTFALVLHNALTVAQSIVILGERIFFDAGLFIDDVRRFHSTLWRQWLDEIGGSEFEVRQAERIALTIDEPAIFLGVPGLRSYHHWLIDALTKLALVDEQSLSEFAIAVPDTVPERFLSPIWMMGADRDRLVRIPQTAAVRYRHLVVLPFIAAARGAVHRGALDETRRRLIARTKPWEHPPAKVLITRRDHPTSTRLLLNEGALITRLQRRGYMPISPGTLALNGQVASMLSANAVIAVHGAGAANLLFTPEETMILHLQPEDSRFQAQGLLSAVRNQRHAYFFGDCFSSTARGQNVEWVLNLDELDEVLDAFGF